MNDESKNKTLSTSDFVAAAGKAESRIQDHAKSDNALMERTLGAASMTEDRPTPLFGEEEGQNLRTRWTGIQTAFVDEPRRAVEQADGLVAETIKHLAEMFSSERKKLEQDWDRGGENVSTEDLRLALRRYRSFFDRLLSL